MANIISNMVLRALNSKSMPMAYMFRIPRWAFVYQKHNPMCYKPGGYVQGAGHGGTFCDVKGNYWHVATCMLS